MIYGNQPRLFSLILNELDQAHFSGITETETQLVDAGVTAVAFRESGSDNVKKVFDRVTAAEFGENQTAAVQITFFTGGDEFFSETAEFFGLDEGSFDLTVDEQAVRHVGEHRPAMSAGTTDFESGDFMTHD